MYIFYIYRLLWCRHNFAYKKTVHLQNPFLHQQIFWMIMIKHGLLQTKKLGLTDITIFYLQGCEIPQTLVKLGFVVHKLGKGLWDPVLMVGIFRCNRFSHTFFWIENEREYFCDFLHMRGSYVSELCVLKCFLWYLNYC